MIASTRGLFSTDIELSCRVTYGSPEPVEVFCKALKIDTNSMWIAVPPHSRRDPDLGDTVHLEVQLPVNLEGAGAKCLKLRAKVARVKEVGGGFRHFMMTFRKVSFRESGRPTLVRKPTKSAVTPSRVVQ